MNDKDLGYVVFAYSGCRCSTIREKIIDKFINQNVYIKEDPEIDPSIMNITVYEILLKRDENL